MLMTSLIVLVVLKSSWPILSIPTKFHCCQTPSGRVKQGAFLPLPVHCKGIPDPVQNRVKRVDPQNEKIQISKSDSKVSALNGEIDAFSRP